MIFRLKKVLHQCRRAGPLALLKLVEARSRYHEKHPGVVVGRDVQGLKHVQFGGNNAVGNDAFFAGDVQIGYGTTVGPNNYLVGPASLGNYCQLGPAVGIYGREHSLNHVSMYLNQVLFEGRLKKNAVIDETVIGHDVWIGHGAVILKGVRIGTGAVIGAGTIVTKDVQDYAIVVGNPGRILRMRFEDEILSLLTESRWWLHSVEELAAFEDLFSLDLVENRKQAIPMLKRMAQRFVSEPNIPRPTS